MSNKPNIIKGLQSFFLNITSQKTTPIAGIDIEPSSMLLLQMGGSLQEPTILHHAMTSISSDTIVNNSVQNPANLIASVENIKQLSKTKLSQAAITAPSSLVIVKQVKVRRGLTEKQQESQAWAEAKKAFPGITNDLYLDFVMLDTPQPDEKNVEEQQMLLIASRKQELQSRLKAIKKGGFDTKIIEVDYYALERAYPLIAHQLPESHTQEHIGILNIDTNTFTLSVIHEKTMTYCHQQDYYGGMLAALVQHHLGLDSNEASTQKDNESSTHQDTLEEKLGLDSNESSTQQDNESSTHQDTLEEKLGMESPGSFQLSTAMEEQIVTQIQRLLQFFYSEAPDTPLTHLVLSGRCAVIPKLDAVVQEKTGVTTLIANPLAKMQFDASVDASNLNRQAPACLLCCGLAMRGLY